MPHQFVGIVWITPKHRWFNQAIYSRLREWTKQKLSVWFQPSTFRDAIRIIVQSQPVWKLKKCIVKLKKKTNTLKFLRHSLTQSPHWIGNEKRQATSFAFSFPIYLVISQSECDHLCLIKRAFPFHLSIALDISFGDIYQFLANFLTHLAMNMN